MNRIGPKSKGMPHVKLLSRTEIEELLDNSLKFFVAHLSHLDYLHLILLFQFYLIALRGASPTEIEELNEGSLSVIDGQQRISTNYQAYSNDESIFLY
jgi:hypothetical protein